MKTSPQSDRLQALRANLQHFDHSPDFGDREAVASIRRHLTLRIYEAERAMLFNNSGQARTEAA